jgi:pimeloyl-ACP methyl ester carboxylesterase
MVSLKVDGAQLHHEVLGKGPLLLCIHGGDGSGEIWRGMAEILKEHFAVVIYDRKHNSPDHERMTL